MDGLLVIDKPGGMTSRDALNRAQRWFPRLTKIGHTGTLDPLATGVLVACVGAATKLADLIQGMGKGYAARVRLGATSDTDDADGNVTPTEDAAPPAEADVRAALEAFVGDIEQTPPSVSALKINGRRAHELARAGTPVVPATRTVWVDSLRLMGYEWPFVDVEIDCGKGTYVRSIARDLGTKLGVGGLVETLRRTRVGPFVADMGVTVDATPEAGRGKMLPMSTATAGLPQVTLPKEIAQRFWRGQVVAAPAPEQKPSPTDWLAVWDDAGVLVGVGVAVSNRPFQIRPLFLLTP